MCYFLKGFRATNLFWELLSFPPRSPHCRPKGRSTGKRNTHCNSLQWCRVFFYNTLKMFLVCSSDEDREPILPGPRYLGAWHHQWPGLTEWSLLVFLQPDRQCRRKLRLTVCRLLYYIININVLTGQTAKMFHIWSIYVTYNESASFVGAAKQTWGMDYVPQTLGGLVFLLATKCRPEVSCGGEENTTTISSGQVRIKKCQLVKFNHNLTRVEVVMSYQQSMTWVL